MGMATSLEEVGDGNCTSSGMGIRRSPPSNGGVRYDRLVVGDEGGEGEEASCL